MIANSAAKITLQTIGRQYATFGAFELGIGALAGERVSLTSALARSTPWVLMEVAVPSLLWPLIGVQIAAGIGQAAWETGRINVEMSRQFSMKAYSNQLYIDSDAASTMRQRSVQIMQGTQMALRSVMQNEGKIMHNRLNPY